MYKLLLFILLGFIVLLHRGVSAKGLELLSTTAKSFKRSSFLEPRENYANSELEDISELFPSRYENNILWSPPLPLYVLNEKNVLEDQERRKKIEHYLLQEEFKRNANLRKAFKVYYANPLQRFGYAMMVKFNNKVNFTYSEASKYILEAKRKQKGLLDTYLSLFSSGLNSQEIESTKIKELVLEICNTYGERALPCIHELYSRFPFLSSDIFHEILEVDSGTAHELGVLPAFKLSPQGLTVINLGDLLIKNFFISNESLLKVYFLDNNVSLSQNTLVIKALASSGTLKLVINTDAGVLNFNIVLSKRAENLDFELENAEGKACEQCRIVNVKGVYRLEEGSFLTIKTHSLITGKILASNPSLTDLEHVVSSLDKDFLKVFLLRIKAVGNTEIIIPTTEKIYKLKLEILRSGLVKDGLQEIYLD